MEAEDKVVSEVHNFSKEESLNCYEEGGKPLISEENSNDNINDTNHINSNEKDSDDIQYACQLGANGQVVLWHPEFETVLSRFEFTYPDYMLKKPAIVDLKAAVDSDGDLNVLRRKDIGKMEGALLIEHQSATTLDLVGEQVWRGALFLADFILHNPHIFRNANVLEVASGVGLSSIVAAMLAKKVIITDVDKGDILELIAKNIKRNKELIKAFTAIREVDFFDLRSIEDLGKLKNDLSVFLAADVIYHNQLTDAFFDAVVYLMKDKPNKIMFIALEKRYVFTIEDMDTVAPCYDYFISRLEWLKSQETSTVQWNIEQIPADFPQYFTYERTRHLVLWKIETSVP